MDSLKTITRYHAMESPMSLWELKPEPVSPLHIYEDAWLLEEEHDAFKQQPEDEVESKAEVYSKLLDDLDQLDQLDDFIKEEPFSNWLEEKVDLPIFEDIRIEPRYTPVPRFKHEDLKPISQPLNHVVQPLSGLHPLHQVQTIEQQQQDTSLLLQEFETVYGHVEMNHGQLTPPQSPPLVLTQLTPLSYISRSLPPQQQLPVYYHQPEVPPATPQPDVAHELAVVEELVRSRTENLVSPSSPSSSSSCSFSEYSSDPEWIPDTVQATSSADASDSLVERSPRGRKRAGKPYQKIGTEDKKSRKKEQNKNAATRYRMKKKAEIEEILSEEKGLADIRGELTNQVSDLQREIKCLKGLMRDLFRAKGLIQ